MFTEVLKQVFDPWHFLKYAFSSVFWQYACLSVVTVFGFCIFSGLATISSVSIVF